MIFILYLHQYVFWHHFFRKPIKGPYSSQYIHSQTWHPIWLLQDWKFLDKYNPSPNNILLLWRITRSLSLTTIKWTKFINQKLFIIIKAIFIYEYLHQGVHSSIQGWHLCSQRMHPPSYQYYHLRTFIFRFLNNFKRIIL